MNHPGGRKLFFVSIVQRSTPTNGEQASYFREKLDAMRKYLATTGLDSVQKPADVEAARSGTPHVVIAVDLRKVADLLRERGVDDKTLRAICFDNYARCLRTAMEARQA